MTWYEATFYVTFYGAYFALVVVAFFKEGKSSGNFFLYSGLAANLAITWYTVGQRLDLSVATVLLKVGLTITLFALMIKGLSELSNAYAEKGGGKRAEWGTEGLILVVYIITAPVAMIGLATLDKPPFPFWWALSLVVFGVIIFFIGILNLRRRQRREKADSELFGEKP